MLIKRRILIISPYFPPINAADMQRVRMSLSYYKDFGWDAEVVTVDVKFTDMVTDKLLTESIPSNTIIHKVKAVSKKWTSKVGLGSIALRSLLYYKRKVNALLKEQHYDLVYFSTTQFPVCILGAYWKKHFGIPYVIDMQDPWHTDYYNDKPKNERPPKYWAAYRINKTLEPIAMKKVDGLIAVSQAYLNVLAQRYQNCRHIPQRTIPFGAFDTDFHIARQHQSTYPPVLTKDKNKINIVYIGRGGKDMADAIGILFAAFKQGLSEDAVLFSRFHFYFIGTSYASAGKGQPTVTPIAASFDINNFVTEITDRIPFYQTLNTLADADALFVPGSNDSQYTASKIYPYVLAKKPLLAIFHPQSSVVSFLKECGVGTVLEFTQNAVSINKNILQFLRGVADKSITQGLPNEALLEHYSAKAMTKKQCELFDAVLDKFPS